MRERELKHPKEGLKVETYASLPMRERELKLILNVLSTHILRRSPCGSAN